MVNFLSGKTAGGFGNYSDFLVFNRILDALPTLADKLTYALTDPAFPCMGDHRRALWLLHHPQVCKVSFEDLVGVRGGGSADAQLATVRRVVEFLGFGGNPDVIPERLADQLFNRGSFTFYRGQIGAWREAFTSAHRRLVADRLGAVIDLYGYGS
jgi:hypothetical protein